MKPSFDNLIVERWEVFRAPLPTNEKEHRIVIFYVGFGTCSFFHVTSQIEKAKRRSRYDINSVIEITPSEWPEVIVKNSCIECSKRNAKEISYETLKNMYKNGKLKFLGYAPENIRRKIINGICYSSTYTDKEKSIMTKD